MTVPNANHATAAVIVALAQATGRPFGDGQAPDPERGEPDYPYGIVEVIPGGQAYGDCGQPSSMLDLVVQVTCVAPTREGAAALGARAFQVLLAKVPDGFAKPITPAAPTRVMNRVHDSSGGVAREGILFNAIDRYVLTLSSV